MWIVSLRAKIVRFATGSMVTISCIGCGDGRPDRVPVAGQVLIDGQPLKYGFVQFLPASGRMSSGRLDANGRFTLGCYTRDDGALLGQHRVAVQGGEYRNDLETYWHAPKRYCDVNSSGLTQEISGPSDNLEILLSWDGKGPYLEKRPGEVAHRPGREPKD